MPQANVQLVRSLMAAVDRRDIDAFAAVTTPDFEWFPVFAAREGEGKVSRIRTFLDHGEASRAAGLSEEPR